MERSQREYNGSKATTEVCGIRARKATLNAATEERAELESEREALLRQLARVERRLEITTELTELEAQAKQIERRRDALQKEYTALLETRKLETPVFEGRTIPSNGSQHNYGSSCPAPYEASLRYAVVCATAPLCKRDVSRIRDRWRRGGRQ